MKLGLLLTLLTLCTASAAFQAPVNSPLLPGLTIAALTLQILALLAFMKRDT